jgi:hypothetical protein
LKATTNGDESCTDKDLFFSQREDFKDITSSSLNLQEYLPHFSEQARKHLNNNPSFELMKGSNVAQLKAELYGRKHLSFEGDI